MLAYGEVERMHNYDCDRDGGPKAPHITMDDQTTVMTFGALDRLTQRREAGSD